MSLIEQLISVVLASLVILMVFNVITVCIQLTVASEKKLHKTLENKNTIAEKIYKKDY